MVFNLKSLIMYLVWALACPQTIMCGSYDETFTFGLFENFEGCKNTFIRELDLLNQLAKIKANLILKRDQLESRLESKVATFNVSIPRLPSPEEVNGATRGIVYLHDTYHFHLQSLAKGLSKFKSGGLTMENQHPLTSFDFYLLSKQAFAAKWYDNAISFLKVAFDLLGFEQGHLKKANYSNHMKKMRSDLALLNNKLLMKHRTTITGSFKILPYEVSAKTLRPKKSQPDYVQEGKIRNRDNSTRQGKDDLFRKICSSTNGGGPSRGHLKCHFLHHHDHYLKLGPFKMEMVSRQPIILMLHDFLDDHHIDYLVNSTKPKLSSQRFHDVYNEQIQTSSPSQSGLAQKKTRIIHKSVQAWIKDLEYKKYYDNLEELEEDNDFVIRHPTLFKLTKRIELATKLNATAKYASTDYQVTNYGLAGLCETHFDPHGYIEGVELPPHPGFQRLKKQGDMIATVMGWLEDVPAGGATAFAAPGFETLVWPRKGSVAFWFNLDKKGYRDVRLVHGGCPVLQGSKWILNKWIYYFDQFDRLPCSLDPEQYIASFSHQFSELMH